MLATVAAPRAAALARGPRRCGCRTRPRAAADPDLGAPPPPPPPPPSGTRFRTRLATTILTAPRRVDVYFAGKPGRRLLWKGIAFGVGFYAANTVSLSFGALSINDVVAAALTVAFYEAASAAYYSAPRATLRLAFVNWFKVGAVVALVADAFKLAG